MEELAFYKTLRESIFRKNEYDKLHVIACLYKSGKISKYDLLDICDETLLAGAMEVVLKLESQCPAPINAAVKQNFLNEMKCKQKKDEEWLMRLIECFDDGCFDKSC